MKPNWPLLAIIAGAVVTVAIVVVIFVSTSGTATHSGLPTTVALSRVPANAVKTDATVDLSDSGCVSVTVDGTKAFAIWPKGFVKDSSGNVLDPNGATYGDGQALQTKAVVTNRAAVVKLDGGGEDGYLGTLMTQCQGSDTHAVIITKVTD